MGQTQLAWEVQLGFLSPPRWVRLNSSQGVFFSTGQSDPATGIALVINPPGGTYTMSTGPSLQGPWTVEDSAYVVSIPPKSTTASDFFALNPSLDSALGSAGPPTSGGYTAGQKVFDTDGLEWIATATGTLDPYRAAVLADSPLLYLRMDDIDGNLADASGNGHAGTAYNGTVRALRQQPGGLGNNANKATYFNSTYGLISALDLTAYQVITVEMLLNWDAYANDDSMACEFGVSNAAFGFYVDPNAAAGTFEVDCHNGTNRHRVRFTRPSAGAYHHYAFVLDMSQNPNVITCYVDGAAVSPTVAASGTAIHAFGNLALYLMSRGGTQLFGKGFLDEYAIYGGSLSAGRVQAHFNAIGSAFNWASQKTTLVPPTGLVWNVKHPKYGAKGDGRIVTDGAITSGTAIFASATAAFTQVDVDNKRQVCVWGAGAAGGPYKGTVLSLNSGTSVNLDTNAGTTVSAAFSTIGSEDVFAIQQAIDDCQAAGGGTVYRPASSGRYLLNTYFTDSGGDYCLRVGGVRTFASPRVPASNVRLFSEGEAAALQQGPGGIDPAGGCRMVMMYTAAQTATGVTLFPFNTAKRNDYTLTMTTASDAGNWKVGDVIFVRSSPPVGSGFYGELNLVTSVNVGTGVVGLRWPLGKPYGQNAPYGAGNATSVTARNLKFENEVHYSIENGLAGGNAIGISAVRCKFERNPEAPAPVSPFTHDFWGVGFIRGMTVRECEVYVDGPWSQFDNVMTDMLLADSRIVRRSAAPGEALGHVIGFTENMSQIHMRGCVVRSSTSAPTLSTVVISEAWACKVEDNWIVTDPALPHLAIEDIGSGNNNGADISIRGNYVVGRISSKTPGTVIENNELLLSSSSAFIAIAVASASRFWILGNHIVLTLAGHTGIQVQGTNHNDQLLGNQIFGDGTASQVAIQVVDNGVVTKSPNIGGNYAEACATGLLIGNLAHEPTLYEWGNDFSGCTTPYNPANPMGGVVAVTVTASPFTYTAGTSAPEEVYIDGGTVTTIVKNGITLYNFAATAAHARVRCFKGEGVTVTYTGAPTMNKERVA